MLQYGGASHQMSPFMCSLPTSGICCLLVNVMQYPGANQSELAASSLQEKGNKSKICLQAEDEAHLLQVESAAIKEGTGDFTALILMFLHFNTHTSPLFCLLPACYLHEGSARCQPACSHLRTSPCLPKYLSNSTHQCTPNTAEG